MSTIAKQVSRVVPGRVARLALLALAFTLSNLAASAEPQLPSKHAAPVANPKAAANPATPCCNITNIDAATGVVTAKVNATGQTFEFKVVNTAVLKSLKMGQGVYANFTTNQVSVDGVTPCCQINVEGAPSPSPGAKPAAPGMKTPVVTPAPACCAITAINQQTGMVAAKANSGTQIFGFSVQGLTAYQPGEAMPPPQPLIDTLVLGQPVWANFATGQVSLDGKTPCCKISAEGIPSSEAASQPPAKAAGPIANPKAKLPVQAGPECLEAAKQEYQVKVINGTFAGNEGWKQFLQSCSTRARVSAMEKDMLLAIVGGAVVRPPGGGRLEAYQCEPGLCTCRGSADCDDMRIHKCTGPLICNQNDPSRCWCSGPVNE